jgi:hypothetical protein
VLGASLTQTESTGSSPLSDSIKRTNQSNIISTAIYSSDSSIDYASRVAKILARKTALPVYVGCSMNFSGLTVEEEMEGLRKIIEMVMTRWKEKL